MSSDSRLIHPAALVRRVLFFVLLIAMTLVQLFINFNGLSSADGIEHAQLGREIARGNGFTTQVIRPVTLAQNEKSGHSEIAIERMPDTLHAPLSPVLHAVVFKVIDATNHDKWMMSQKDRIYELDRVIAALSIGFFMIALCISYFVVARIFDARIAGFTALLLLFCDLIWKFSLSGLPQMLMLMLFSAGIYYCYRAVEAQNEGGKVFGSLLVATLFMVALALTNWLAIWVLVGYFIFTIAYFKPRGSVAIIGTLLFIAGAFYNLYQNYQATGSPFGTAFLTCYNSDPDIQQLYMRSGDLGDVQFNFRNLLLNLAQTTFQQVTDLLSLLGGIIVAPLFFLSLLHPFKRKSIADFRWALLAMFFCAAIGMAIFGLGDEIHSNQLFLLFIPVMTGYGLAIVSIFWARLGIAAKVPALANAHFILVVIVSSTPMMLGLIVSVKDRTVLAKDENIKFRLNYPYAPEVLNVTLNLTIPKSQALVTDQPEGVAWYADRAAVLLPRKVHEHQKLDKLSQRQDLPVSGILITPSSYGQLPVSSNDFNSVLFTYGDFAAFVLDIPLAAVANNRVVTNSTNPSLDELRRDYGLVNDSRRRANVTEGNQGPARLIDNGMYLYRKSDEDLLREAQRASEERKKSF